MTTEVQNGTALFNALLIEINIQGLGESLVGDGFMRLKAVSQPQQAQHLTGLSAFDSCHSSVPREKR